MNDEGLVADASAILAALKNEPFDKFDPERLIGVAISTVNFCEVLGKLHADGLTKPQADDAISRMNLRIIPFDRDQAVIAAELWLPTRRAGLSLGDRACLALGDKLHCQVVTADRAWGALDIGVEVILIR